MAPCGRACCGLHENHDADPRVVWSNLSCLWSDLSCAPCRPLSPTPLSSSHIGFLSPPPPPPLARSTSFSRSRDRPGWRGTMRSAMHSAAMGSAGMRSGGMRSGTSTLASRLDPAAAADQGWRRRCHAHPHGVDRPQLTHLSHRTGAALASPPAVAPTPAALSSRTCRGSCSDRACVDADGGAAEDGQAGPARGEGATLLHVLASFDLHRQPAQRWGSGMLRVLPGWRWSRGGQEDTVQGLTQWLGHGGGCQGAV